MKFARLKKLFIRSLAAGGILSAMSVARAEEPRVHWHVMGGYSEPLGTTSDYLQGGYTFGGGFSVLPSAYSPIDFRFDLNYSEHNASNRLINAGQQATNIQIDGGTGQFWSVTGNLVYRIPLAYGVRGYGIAGIGAYHSRVELTQVVPFGGGYYYCDPFSGFCDGAYSDAVVAAHDVTKFGWNAGIGAEFSLPYGNSWFIETRYHRINTSTPIEYLPIEIGYRF